jgi:hypothetical protein
MEDAATQAVGDGRYRSGLASETNPDTGRLSRKRMTLYGIRRGGDGHQTQKRGQPKRASTQQIAILHFKKDNRKPSYLLFIYLKRIKKY